jgi:hypothetical protein
MTIAGANAPPGSTVTFAITYEDGTQGETLQAEADDNGVAQVTFEPASEPFTVDAT